MRVKAPISEMMVGTKRGREANETLLGSVLLAAVRISGVCVNPTSQNSKAQESTTWDPECPPRAL
jgi:hypothetical protein